LRQLQKLAEASQCAHSSSGNFPNSPHRCGDARVEDEEQRRHVEGQAIGRRERLQRPVICLNKLVT
jgi:hypothetical protein